MPDLDGATAWLNSEPLTPAGLRGKVVVVQFCTFSCVNWLRTLPYVRAWAEKYRDDGLVVIGAHSPEFPFEHDVEKVRPALEAMGVDYPIAIDNDFAVWRAFGNRDWPALYFIDAQGRIRHHHFGEEDYERSETGHPAAARRGGTRRRRRGAGVGRAPWRGARRRLGHARVSGDLCRLRPGDRASRLPAAWTPTGDASTWSRRGWSSTSGRCRGLDGRANRPRR